MISAYSTKTGQSVPAINQQLQEIKSIIANSLNIKTVGIDSVSVEDISAPEIDTQTGAQDFVGNNLNNVDPKGLGKEVMREAMDAQVENGYATVNMVVAQNGEILYLSNNPQLPSSMKDLIDSNQAIIVSMKVKVDLSIEGKEYSFSSPSVIPSNLKKCY